MFWSGKPENIRINGRNKEVWTECSSCQDKRWVRLVKGRPKATMCLPCGTLWRDPKISEGTIFGSLTVLGFSHIENKRALYFCQCVCGEYCSAKGDSLQHGQTKTCGCRNGIPYGRKITHGMTNSSEYQSWLGAKSRTTNANSKDWEHYGGRGITMDKNWQDDFSAFYSYVGSKPGPEYSLDRIDNDGNYEPGNVRWADRTTQMLNRRKTLNLLDQEILIQIVKDFHLGKHNHSLCESLDLELPHVLVR